MNWKKKSLIVVFSFLALSACTLGWLFYSLPSHLTERANTTQALILLDRHGNEVRSYNPKESYDWVTLDKIPVALQNLVMLSEDQHFYAHHGLDFKGIARSFWLNFKQLRIVSGASTITQQSYRMSHNLPRNFWGKLQAMIGAVKVENHYSKKQILEHYLNALPLGKKVVGVKRGAEVYFDKPLESLSLAEMATLAVLPRSPNFLQTKKQIKRLTSLRDDLLERSEIAQDQLALEKKVPLDLKQEYSGWDNYHFMQKVMAEKDFPRYVDSNGRVRTTLDIYLQKEVNAILKAQIQHLKKYHVGNGAVVVLNNEDGGVLAYAGTSDVKQIEGGQYDALQVKRQVGSTLKPFTYALALQSGATLARVLPDVPSYYKTGLGQFLPRNYDHNYSGPRLMRESLANSLNLPAVALADELGPNKLHSFLKNLGLPLDRPAEHYGVGLTLGNAEITPYELIQSYTALARHGKRVDAKVFAEASTVERATELTEQTSFLISHVLQDRVARREEFGERNPFDVPFTLSVKTGTSTDFRDNWAVGYNERFTILVWVGNMDQRAMKKVSGITGAGPVLAQVARYLAKTMMIPRLSVAQGVEGRNVCALSGKAPGKACRHQKLEYFLKSDAILETCDYHQEYTLRDCHQFGDERKESIVVLPDLYQAFVYDHADWSVAGQVANLCPSGEAQIVKQDKNHSKEHEELIIQRPLPGSLYAVDPNIPPQFQKLKLELNQFHGVKKVRWKVNEAETIIGNSILDWPMKKGKHSFSAEVEFSDGRKEKTPKLSVTVL